MWKPIAVLLIVAIAGGLYYFTSRYEIRREDGRIVIHPRAASPDGDAAPSDPTLPPAQTARKTIRIATFNAALDRNKLASALVAGHLAELIRDFDVVALQNVRASNQGAIRELVDRVNVFRPALRLRRQRRGGHGVDRSLQRLRVRQGRRRNRPLDGLSGRRSGGTFSDAAPGRTVPRAGAGTVRGLHVHTDQRERRSGTSRSRTRSARRRFRRGPQDPARRGRRHPAGRPRNGSARPPAACRDSQRRLGGGQHGEHDAGNRGWPTTSCSIAARPSSSPAWRTSST